MDPKRVFNMDESSFFPSKTSTKVVVHRSTKHAHVDEAVASSNVTIVACVGADGSKIPPLFVLPGDRMSTDICDNLVIPGAAVTTSEKGWTNSYICRQWLSMLSLDIPVSTLQAILLTVDGYSSLYYIYDEAQGMDILLLFLPANSTHMFQPLDVTVFRPFKQAIRQVIVNDKWNDVATRTSTTKESSITNGFDSTGLCPPSLEKMLYRLSIFKPPQDDSIELDDTWLQQVATVASKLLLLPLQKKKRIARKTLTISGKFITADYHATLQSQAVARPKARKMILSNRFATRQRLDSLFDLPIVQHDQGITPSSKHPVASSNAAQDPSGKLRGRPVSKYGPKSFVLQFKYRTVEYRHRLDVINRVADIGMSAFLDSYCVNYSTTQRETTPKKVYGWIKRKGHIEQHATLARMAHQQCARKRGTGTTLPLDAQEQLARWVLGMRKDGIPVTYAMLRMMALETAIDVVLSEDEFKAGWH
ncbi:hypothetical protein B5M09_010648 [Aphanomyces astaci]|uniref:HTH CENPB-type domain-containing protein n=1 Tax=Aphanomyces astaci TaxID=112090 RepID=A0A425CTI9_APHAT|nr:hypothetical protein B5M09_010648 [Aphanomyces astaci]